MFTIQWDVKEPTHYSKRVGHEGPGVVAVLCESIAGPHQLIAAKKTQPAQSNKRKKKESNRPTLSILIIIIIILQASGRPEKLLNLLR